MTRPDGSARGQIKLRYEFDGQTFQDVIEIGGSFDLDLTAENRGDAIVVTVINPNPETVEGEVSIVTPLETWPEALVGGYARLDVSPRTQGVSVPAGESVELTYTVRPAGDRRHLAADSYWAVAKLMSNGRISLKRCDNTPERRLLDDAKWLDTYRARAEQYTRRRKR